MMVYAVLEDDGSGVNAEYFTTLDLARAYAKAHPGTDVEEVEVWDRLPQVTDIVIHEANAMVNPDGSLFNITRSERTWEHDERRPELKMASTVRAAFTVSVVDGGERKVPYITVYQARSVAEVDAELARVAAECARGANWARITHYRVT